MTTPKRWILSFVFTVLLLLLLLLLLFSSCILKICFCFSLLRSVVGVRCDWPDRNYFCFEFLSYFAAKLGDVGSIQLK